MFAARWLAPVIPICLLLPFAGCFSTTEQAAAPVPPPTTTTVVVPGTPGQQVITYSEGRYEMRGDGRTVPYYWVWVPSGATLSPPPVPPTSFVQRTVTYPYGRYELRCDGSTVPYYWVWIPAGYNPPWPPQPIS